MADGNADWGLYKNPIDAFTETVNSGQDRAFLQNQRQAAIQKQQDDAAQAAASAAALPAIRQQVQSGDYTGAQIAAQFSGNAPISDFVGKLAAEHQQKLGDMANTLGSTAYGLKQIADPTARAAAFDAAIPALKAHGIADTDIQTARANLSDDALNGYINSAQTVRQHVEDAQKATDQGLRQQEINKPIGVSGGEVLYDPVTRQPIYQAPETKVVALPNGGQGIYETGGGASAGASGVAPMGTGNSRPERNNNPGNVRALPNGQQWRGQIGTDPQGYAIFGDVGSGQRAADRNLQSYGRQGINTVSGIVSRWAPRGDRNNTDQYIASVASALGVDPKQPLDLTDPNVRQALLSKGIYPNEGPVGRQANAPRNGGAQPTGAVGGRGHLITFGDQGGTSGPPPEVMKDVADLAIANGGRVPQGYARNKAIVNALPQAVHDRAQELGLTMQDVVHMGQDNKGGGAMIVDMAKGQSGKLVQFGNVAVEHLAQLRAAALAQKNGNIPLFNSISQAYQRNTGSPIPTNAASLRGVVANEIQKAVSGSAGALHDREDLNSNLNTAGSPDQIIGSIDGYQHLIASQIHGVQTRYQAATGRNDFNKYLTPGAARVLGFSGGGASQPVRVTSPQQAAALPPGTRFQTPDGRIITKH